jgi:transposase
LARANRKTAAYFLHRFRHVIARQLEDSLPVEGLVEVDKRYFRGVRKGKRGRGGADEIPVFGILKRGGKVTTVMIPDVPKDTLLPIIQREVVRIRSSIPTPIPLWVLDVSEFDHHGIDHSDAYVLDRHNNINGIENFWNQAKGTLSRYNGIPKAHFPSFSRKLNFASTSEHPAPQTLGQTQGLANPFWDNPFPIWSFTGTTGAHWRQLLTNLQYVRVVRLMTMRKQAFSRQRRQRLAYPRTPCRSSKRGYELPLSVCRFF